MKHPLSRLFAPIGLIVGVALATVAAAGHHGAEEEQAADIVDVAATVPISESNRSFSTELQ